MPTFDLISSTTSSGSASTVTLGSIPSTYTDLELHCNLIPSTTLNYYVRVNGSSATTYRMMLTGSVGTSDYQSGQTAWIMPSATGTGNVCLRITLDNYSNTAAEKSGTYQLNRNATTIEYGALMRVNTEAISSVSITTSTGNFTDGSTFHLYGIASS
jgi:hypothetical protein